MTASDQLTTNLSMTMQLGPKDPYSILHADLWGKPAKESLLIKTETVDVPTEDDLSSFEPTSYNTLDVGDGVTVFPDNKFRMIVRDEYPALWKWIADDRNTPGRQFGGMVVIGQSGIGECSVTCFSFV